MKFYNYLRCFSYLIFVGMLLLFPVFDVSSKEKNVIGSENIALVDGYAITKLEFTRGIDLLHTSATVGRSLQGDRRSFSAIDFQKYFNDMVSSKLMMVEAGRLDLDELEEVAGKLTANKLTYLLERLREDEVFSKIKISNKEINDYFVDQKREEEKVKREKAAEFLKSQGAESDEGEIEELKALDSEEYRKEILATMNDNQYEAIREGFIKVKRLEREKEYFESLRKKGRIKKYKKIIKKVSKGDVGIADSTIAKVRGKKITAREVWLRLPNDAWKDVEKVEQMVDSVVLEKLLNKEAESKGYEKEPNVARKILRYRETILVSAFKNVVINKLIKVSEEEIKEFYDKNIDVMKYPDDVNLSIIKVSKKEEAEGIIEELGLGTEFAYIARTRSLHSSRAKDGSLGWVSLEEYPNLSVRNVRTAPKGSLAGPFEEGTAFVILQLNGFREGRLILIDEARKGIDLEVGRLKVEPTIEKYIDRLKESSDIRYDEEELKKYGIKPF